MSAHMKKRTNHIAAYLYYPMIFLLLFCGLWVLSGRELYDYADAKICEMMIQGAPAETKNVSLFQKIQEDLALVSQEQAQPEYGESYGFIECKERDLKVPLYYGDDESILRLGAGQYEKSSMPGSEGISIIGAHDQTYFSTLGDLVTGDRITIQTIYGRFSYEVSGQAIAGAQDTWAYEPQNTKEQVILYTCYPIGEMGKERSDRYYVYCTRVPALEAAR